MGRTVDGVTISIAGKHLSLDEAVNVVRDYAVQHHETIRIYDYADARTPPAASDGVLMADIARLVVIAAQLHPDDVPALLDPVDPRLWQAVPHAATYRDLDLSSGAALLADPLYDALCRLYAAYSQRTGLKIAKITKLLHVKRPQLVPVVDSVVKGAYLARATELQRESKAPWPMFWGAVWMDALQNAAALEDLKDALRDPEHPAAALAELSPLRLIDVLIWQTFG